MSCWCLRGPFGKVTLSSTLMTSCIDLIDIYCTVVVTIHSFILAISIAPLQVLYHSEAFPTTARILYLSFTPKRTGNCHILYTSIFYNEAGFLKECL